MLRRPPGGRIRLLGADAPLEPGSRAILGALGLAPAAPCWRLPSLWDAPTVSCSTVAAPTRPSAVAAFGADAAADFSSRGAGWIFLGANWGAATATGVPMTAPGATLILDLPAGPDVFEVLAPEFAATAPAMLLLSVSGRDPVRLALPAGTGAATGTVCLSGLRGVLTLQVRIGGAVPPDAVLLRTMRRRAARPGECPS